MSEIKRYYLQDDRRDNEPLWYVSYDDHLSAIEQARIDAVREFAGWVKKVGNNTFSIDPLAKDFIEQKKEQGE